MKINAKDWFRAPVTGKSFHLSNNKGFITCGYTFSNTQDDFYSLQEELNYSLKSQQPLIEIDLCKRCLKRLLNVN